MLSTSQDNEAPVQHQSLIFLQNIALKNEPIVRGPTKQDYLTHEAGINASRTIGSFLWVVVVIIFFQLFSIHDDIDDLLNIRAVHNSITIHVFTKDIEQRYNRSEITPWCCCLVGFCKNLHSRKFITNFAPPEKSHMKVLCQDSS